MKKSKVKAPADIQKVPLLAVEVFRHHHSPFAWMAGPASGKEGKTLADFEEPFRVSHVAIERARQDPTSTGLLNLLRSLLPALKVSPLQTTVHLAWAEVLLRECKNKERFSVGNQDLDRIALAEQFLVMVAPLRGTPPFRWVLPYLEYFLASGSPKGSPSIALERAASALKAATAAGEPLSTRMALKRLRDAARARLGETRQSSKPRLILRKDGNCLLVGGAVVSLTPREFTMLWATAEGGTLSRKRGVELLVKLPSLSGGGIPGAVEEDALRAHRKSILAKVGEKVGKEYRDRLAMAFRSEKRVYVYDEAVLPFTVE